MVKVIEERRKMDKGRVRKEELKRKIKKREGR